jgi:microcin C transport system substrate-binding protein
MIEKIFFNEYLPENSYFPGSPYENSANPKNDYNPQEALKLLADAGWKDRDAQGHLTKDGKPLAIEMLYDDKQLETYLTVYQEDLRKIGITLNLRLVTFETDFKLISERQFQMNVNAWGADLFPNPEAEWHSRLADVNDTDNITGFKDPRIDAICEKYKVAFDPKQRESLIRDLDLIMTEQYHYALQWYAPAQRIAYWNRFGMPPGLLTRIGQYMSSISLGPGPEQLWWIDPDKAQKLDQAMRSPSMRLEVGPTENRYWEEYAKKEEQKAAN